MIYRKCPLNYGLCNQTVTVYHLDKETKNITTTVFHNAFLDYKKNQNIEKTGSKESNSFLLVLPTDTQTVFVGDKVLHGTGKPVTDVSEYNKLMPTNTNGLVVVKYVDCKYWRDKMVHLEAGG